jgi:hypothetical protein
MLDNPHEETVEIQWVYTPADFFDGKIERDCEGYSVEIEGGRAVTRMSAAFYKPGPDFRPALTEELRNYFRVWQLDRPIAFEIHDGGVNRLCPDGRINSTLAAHSCSQEQVSDNVDLVQMDRTGAIVRDAGREERFDALKKLAEFRLRHASDPTTLRMLKSQADSIAKPEEALFCLYEIWDALMEKYKGRKNAQRVLNIPQEQLDTFNNLTCKRQLRQSRHRGRFNNLRDATAEELVEARRIAQLMVEGYWKYLDDQQRAK